MGNIHGDRKRTVSAVVFDMDDTLYPERDYVLSGLRETDRYLTDRFGLSGFYAASAERFRTGSSRRLFNDTLDQLSFAYDENLIHELVRQYRKHTPAITLFHDAAWALERLTAAHGVKLGLISDGFLEAQKRKVTALDLERVFEAVILSDGFGREHWKPSPVPYEEMSFQLGAGHETCVYIGDNPLKDFVTAKRLGWLTVHVCREDGVYARVPVPPGHEAHYRISSLYQLSGIPELTAFFEADLVSERRRQALLVHSKEALSLL
ncbi:HAD family hydrolase [Paenibacillus gansuensis]|uniref:HAD family hydrolase n=1 Tax=Paenibacillus gansuensis TaxID=306542 RepID=A0ABW5PFM6_9BACL